LLAVQVIAIETGRAEADDDALAIRDRRRLGIEPRLEGRLVGLVLDVALPEFLAVLAVETHQRPLVPLLVERLRDEDAIAPDHRRRVSRARQFHLPADILGGAPGERQPLLRRVAVAARATEARPVLRPRHAG